jgi:hypothetical protein
MVPIVPNGTNVKVERHQRHYSERSQNAKMLIYVTQGYQMQYALIFKQWQQVEINKCFHRIFIY